MKITSEVEVSDFITTEQAKQELELFVKEKGLTTIGVGHDSVLSRDEGSGINHVLISSSCSSECTHEPSLFLSMRKDDLSGKYGCFKYQLDIIKMMMERIYCRGIKFYHDCNSLAYTAWSDEFSFVFYARDYAVCDLKLNIAFELSHEDDKHKLTLGIYSTGHRKLLDRFTDDYIPCMMSTAGHNDGMLLIQSLSSIDIVEISYNHVVMEDGDIAKEISIFGETFRRLFLFLRGYRMSGGFRPNKKSDILNEFHRNYEMFKRSYPMSDAHSTIQTFLLQVLERSSVEVFCVRYFLSDLSISFAVGDRMFAYYTCGNQGSYIGAIETRNRLTLTESTDDIDKTISAVCEFLGIQLE